MNVCVLWVGAFWFAMLKLIENSPNIKALYAYEQDKATLELLRKQYKHPYFFEGVSLSDKVVFTNDYEAILPSVDIVILAIPCQFISPFLPQIREFLKPWVIILNLAKWINNTTLRTIYNDTQDILTWKNYEYAILSGGMIAKEVVEWKPLWAQIGVTKMSAWIALTQLFIWTNLEVKISLRNIQTIELYASLKNVFAMMIGYYEGKGCTASTLWYYFCKIYQEIDIILKLLWWSEAYHFSDFAVGWDLIATCFWDSRNRYFWNLIGQGKSPKEALEILASEKKRSEWYETLKWIYKLIKNNQNTPLVAEFSDMVLTS